MRSSMHAVLDGARSVNRAKRVLSICYAVTLAFALLALLPLAAVLMKSLGKSLYADRLFAGLEPQWVAEIVFETRGWPAVTFLPAALGLAAGYLLVSTFLAGGAIAVLAEPPGAWRPGAFWEACGRNFWRLFRLLLLWLVVFGIVLAINRGIDRAGSAIWGEGMEERPLVIFGWVRAGFVLALLMLSGVIFDYAKVRLVLEDSRRSIRAFLASARFVFVNFSAATGAFLAVTTIGLLLGLVFWLALGAIPRTAAFWLLAAFVVQQAAVLARIWIKLLYYASETRVYLGLRQPPAEYAMVAVEKPEDPPELRGQAEAEPEPL